MSNLRRSRTRARRRRASTSPSLGVVSGVFCRTNITWNSGVRLSVALRRRAPPRAARTAGPGARTRRGTPRARGSSSSAKLAIAATVGAQHQRVDEEADQLLDLRSACGPAIGVPDHDVVAAACSRDSRSAGTPRAAVMNSVAPSRRPQRAERRRSSVRGERNRRASRRDSVRCAAAGPVAGSSSAGGLPVELVACQYASCRSSTRARRATDAATRRSPRTATAAARSGDARPRAERGVERVQLARGRRRASTRPRRCGGSSTTSTWSLGPSATSRARSTGPAPRSNGRGSVAPLRSRAAASLARSSAGTSSRSIDLQRCIDTVRVDHLHGPPATRRRTSCAAPRAAARSRRALRSNAARVERARQAPSATVHVVEGVVGRTSWSRNQSRSCANESSAALRVPAPRSVRSIGPAPATSVRRRRRELLDAPASSATVGAVEQRRAAAPRRERVAATRDTTWVARSECPPSSKKLSWTPTSSRPSSSAQIAGDHLLGRRRAARRRALGARRGRPSGAAKRAPVDLAVRRSAGIASRNTKSAGTM